MDICIPELVCPEDYDCKSAKLEASLSWLLAKAGVNWRNESGICTDECSSLLTPSVINGLASGFFYFKAMCTIFPKDIKFFDQSHLSIVRWLLRQGFEVLPEEINFDILKKTDPFNQDMHITLIDKIMAAFIYQTLSVENVVKAVRRFSTFSASSELPSTIEETIVFWSNKVSQKVCEKYQSFLVPESNSEFKIAGNHSFYDCLVVNELEDFAWGRSLACLLSFYRPDKMIFEDICLDENSGIADSLYNLQLCAEVCSQIFEFPTSASQAQLLHLTVTDVFYAHVHLTVNLMTFFADLFECFELSNSLYDENSKVGGPEVLPIKLPKISDVTKRSFHGNATKDENAKVLPSSRTSSLLPLRRDINQKEDTNDENVTKFGPLSDHCLVRKALCLDANEITKDRIDKAQNHHNSDIEEIVSTRDASSIDLSSSSREIVGNRIPIPCSMSSSCSSREAFVHYNHSKSHSFERPRNAQEAPNFGHYRSRPSHSFSSTNDSDSQKLTFSTINSKHTNCDPITKFKTNAGDSILQNDRHIRYCHDLGLISGVSKFRRQSGSGVPKLALSSPYPSDGNLNNYNSMTDGDDEVSSITGEAADDEEFATPPEEFGQRNDAYAGKDYFNNSNSNLSKANGASSKEVSYRKNFLESSNGASNRSLKTSWLRQKKLACPEDEAAGSVKPTKKEAQRNGTFRVVKGCKDEVTDFEENKTKNLCSSSTTYTMSSLPKTSFSLLKQKHPKTKKIQDLTNAPTISQPKSNLTLGKTTWINSMSSGNAGITKDNDNLNSPSSNMSSKMGFLKMELTEKRRQIEGKKLSSDILWSKQRQQVGTEAFMQVVKGHKNIKSCDKDFDHAMERIVESLSPNEDVPVLQNFEQPFDSNTAESLPRDNLSEYEKYSIKGVVNNHPDSYSKEKDVSVNNESSVINQNEGIQNKEVTQVFENNLDTVRTIDHLTHSLSELKGEVKRLSLEQDQLKGFVSVSQTPVTKNNKKLRQTQTQQKDILSHLQRTKPYSSPIKVPDLVPYENCYSKPQFDSESLQYQPKPTTHISTATKSLSYQHMPSHSYSSQLISEARPVGIGGTGSSCTPPLYSVYTTLPNKRAHRPLSSDGRFIQVPEYLPPSELAYEYPSDVLRSYQHPLMTLPHPYAPPHSSSHVAYQFPLRDHVGSVNVMRHHPSSIAFTIPNDPPNLLQHNVLPDWPSTSYHGNYPSTYQIGDKVPPGFVPGVAPVASFASDLNSMHFSDPNQVIVTLNSNHPQSPQFTPISFRQKSFDIINESASIRGTPEQSKQVMFSNLSEIENHLDGGHTFPEQKIDVKEMKCTEHPQHNQDKAFSMQEDVADFENQPSNKSDNNALRSPVETLNGNGESADVDEMKLWKAAEEELEALAQSSGTEEKRKTIKENPVAFVVSQSSNENINMDELEKRKQRLEEMHAKRREEQEMKRLKLERDALIKKELQRQREEQALQKRAEDRARREAIYQTYMQKKSEGFGEEEVGSKGDHSAVPRAVSSHPQVVPSSAAKRQKSARTTRRAGTPSLDDKIKEQQFAGANASPLPHSQEAQTPLAKVSTTSNASSEEKESAKEYTGPKLFVKPCHKSNRNIIENAISHCCLAGVVNQETKAKVLEVLKNSESKHFVILFRDVGMQYRGLYTYDLEEETITKIQGVGPKALTNKHIEKFFKYNSGSKNFSEVSSTKHLSATIDAITLYGAVWQRLKANALAGSKRNLT